MDSVVHNALKRREELQRELRDVDRFLALYERFKGESSQQPLPGFGPEEGPSAGEQDADESGLDQETEIVSEVPSSAPLKGLNRLQLRPHIAAVIEEAGRPLTRGVLLRKLDQRGVQVGGSYDRSKNMGTIMWRLRDDFVNLPGLGYWPRHLTYEPAGYAPDPDSRSVVQSDFDDPQA